MLNEGNQIHNFISSSGSGTVIIYGSSSFLLFNKLRFRFHRFRFRFHNTDISIQQNNNMDLPMPFNDMRVFLSRLFSFFRMSL